MIRLHPLSAFIGAAIVGLCLLTMSQMRVAGAVIRIEYQPHPIDMVQIKEGTPFTVPTGKVLAITGLGGTRINSFSIALYVNGTVEASTYISLTNGTNDCLVAPVPSGLTALPGSVVHVTGGEAAPDDARAWGYLAPM